MGTRLPFPAVVDPDYPVLVLFILVLYIKKYFQRLETPNLSPITKLLTYCRKVDIRKTRELLPTWDLPQ